jgi:sporulation protein YlmC with PRC-barrel domain
LKGKAIVDLRDGIKIGTFEDLMVSPDQLSSKLLITNKGTVFSRHLEGILMEDVRVWGRDVILVENQDVLRPLNGFTDSKSWVLASEQLKQRTVVSIDGKRVGQVDDLVLDNTGRITGVSLSQVYLKGPISQMKEIPVESIRSLGPDVVVIDLDRVQMPTLTEDYDLSPEGNRPADARPEGERILHTPYVTSSGDQVYDGGAQIYEREPVRR